MKRLTPPKRITIIPSIHGKLTRDRKMSEPDIYWILEKWLVRHPEVKGRERDLQITRGRWTLPEGNLQQSERWTAFLGGRRVRLCSDGLPVHLSHQSDF